MNRSIEPEPISTCLRCGGPCDFAFKHCMNCQYDIDDENRIAIETFTYYIIVAFIIVMQLALVSIFVYGCTR